jgi:hypothetical protein
MPKTIISLRQVTEFTKRAWWAQPSTGAAILTIGCAALTTSGTLATSALASTNRLTSTRRTTISSGTTAGTVASLRQAQTDCWRGNSAGLGGFVYTVRFGLDTLQTGMRSFIGLADVTTVPTNVDPTTNTTPGKIGVAINASTGNWQLVTNVTASAPAVTDLGANFPVNVTNLLELTLSCSANDGGISWVVTNLSSGNESRGRVTTNLPANTTFLSPSIWVTNNATAAAAILAIAKIYMEN